MKKSHWETKLYHLPVYIDVDCGEHELGFAIGLDGFGKLEKLVGREMKRREREVYRDVYKGFCEWEMPRDLSRKQKETFDELLGELYKLEVKKK